MPTLKTVTLLKSGNHLVVEPTTPAITALLAPQLTFTTREMLFGRAKRDRGTDAVYHRYQLYFMDHKQRVSTSLGFYRRITDVLVKAGYTVLIEDIQPRKNPEILVPRWDRLYGEDSKIQLRPGQDEFLFTFFAQVAAGLPARFEFPTGFGKSTIIGVIAKMLPKAVIHIVAKRIPVLKERLLPELRGMLPNVGMCGGGLHNIGQRVQLFSFDSLHHSDGKADLVINDEVQDCAADSASEKLARYATSLNYGFSATPNMRPDGKSIREEAIFGPVISSMHYQTAVGHGLVVPVEVRWADVRSDLDPIAGIDDLVERKRLGVWRNELRNQVIADTASRAEHADQQILITCETLEHVLALQLLLPDFTAVYAARDITYVRQRYYQRQGIWPEGGLQEMTPERLTGLTKRFERGALRKVIVTTCWNAGVSMNQLQVVCRADAGSSPINDTQIPGRASRTDEATAKTLALVYDYKDQFNSGFKQRAARRFTNYGVHNWKQVDAVSGAELRGGLFGRSPMQHIREEDHDA